VETSAIKCFAETPNKKCAWETAARDWQNGPTECDDVPTIAC